jgi:hypothetical protein
MLFDLRARGRRTTIKVIYVFLALLMGGGLIFFGIGGATSGGLLDAFKSNGGGSSAEKLAQQKVDKAQKLVQVRGQDPAAWAALTKAFYQQAGVESSTDATTNQTVYNNDGKKHLAQAGRSWDRYLTLAGDKADVSLAKQITGVFAQLNKPTDAVKAIEVVINREPTYGNYYEYATLAYAAGQSRKGDLAAEKAVALAPKDQRKDVQTQLKALKAQPAATQPTTTG